MAKRKVKRRTPIKKVRAEPIQEGESPTISELVEYLKLIPDEIIGKASMASAYAIADMYTYDQELKMPKNVSDWIGLYVKHVWVYAGIFAIANTAAQLGFKLYQKPKAGEGESEEPEEIKDHAILNLLAKPNDSMTGYDLLEGLFVYLETAGYAYWESVYGQQVQELAGTAVQAGEEVPVELWPIRPDRLKPQPRRDGHGVEKYIYQTKPHATKRDFTIEQIVPFKYFNPTNEWFGLGSIQPAIDDVQQDKQMAKWNLDFFVNGITPAGLLYTDKPMGKKEVRDIGKQFKATIAGKGRKIMILSKNLKWQMISVPPKDIEFLAGRKENRQAILAALGVPPIKVGLLEHAKYDNYALQLEAFHRDTLLPKLRKVESALNCYLVIRFPDLVKKGERAWIEFDKAGLLKEDEDAIVKRSVSEIQHGMLTPNEARIMRGRDEWPEETPGGNSFYMTKNLVPIGAPAEETEESLEMREDEVYQKVEALEDRVVALIEEMKEELKEEIKAEVKKEIKDSETNE